MIAYVITGTTRGLGKALVCEALDQGDWVFSLSRAADCFEGRHYNLFCDLSCTDKILDRLEHLLSHLPGNDLTALVLINNAGLLPPIAPMHSAEDLQIQKNINVNFIAPAILIAGFIKLTQTIGINRRIINISSGASQNAYAGWASYCSSKAGLNMLTRCVALEQRQEPNAVKISAVAPGVVDTDMQTQIRQSSQTEFPMRERFILLNRQRALLPPELVAKTLLDLDRRDALVHGEFHDIRKILK